MGIGRLLIIAAIVWFAIRLYRSYRRARLRSAAPPQGKLVRCAQCGVYLPVQETKPDADNAPVCAHHRSEQ